MSRLKTDLRQERPYHWVDTQMLGSLGISDWITAAVTTWLAVQLPLGIVVGICLRRINAVTMPETVSAITDERVVWPELLAAPRPAPVLH
jgi:hypothetical protein